MHAAIVPPHLVRVRDVHKAEALAHVAAWLCDDLRMHHLCMWLKQLPQHVAVVRLGQVTDVQLAGFWQLFSVLTACTGDRQQTAYSMSEFACQQTTTNAPWLAA
jgi:hypothetical protein